MTAAPLTPPAGVAPMTAEEIAAWRSHIADTILPSITVSKFVLVELIDRAEDHARLVEERGRLQTALEDIRDADAYDRDDIHSLQERARAALQPKANADG